jgi:hypothetical protein
MQAGFVLLRGHVGLALSGVAFLHFLSALVLLAIGWNFAFIGGTALLPQTYQPAEWLKVQAVNEFAVFGLAALLRGDMTMPDGHNQGRVQIG